MTEEEKRPQEVPQKRRHSYAGGALLIAITVFIITLFTGGIAYGVQNVMGDAGKKVDGGNLVGGVREFRISAPQWNFTPGNIKVNPGETVRFIVTSEDITHGFAINELGINIPLSPGVAVAREVVIPPDIADGTYTMYCSVFCGIGHPYMKGRVIVGAPGADIGKILPYIATTVMAGMFATFIIIGRRRVR